MCYVLNIDHIRRSLKHWSYRHHWNTNMIQVYTILHAIDEADRKNLPNGILYTNKGANSEMIQKDKKRCRLNLRSNYFPQRVIDLYNGLPTTHSLNAFKSRLNRFWKYHPSLLPHGGPSQTGKTTTKSIHRGYLA